MYYAVHVYVNLIVVRSMLHWSSPIHRHMKKALSIKAPGNRFISMQGEGRVVMGKYSAAALQESRATCSMRLKFPPVYKVIQLGGIFGFSCGFP